MSGPSPAAGAPVTHGKFFYGWVIMVACALMLAVAYGVMYSYSVFFKPLADHFGWDRATVSLIYSASLVIRGFISIGIGWLADRYGARKIMVLCGVMIALGLVLSSQVQTLWQFFITYALIEALGLSGAFGIATAVTSRWFVKKRGLALGIVSSGIGLGTLLIVPGAERLIAAFSWPQAFIICGVTAGLITVVSALFLRPAPPVAAPPVKMAQSAPVPPRELTLGEALRSPRMIILNAIFALLIFCTQMVIVHLVNYATDTGITPLVAATFVSLIGVSSIGGRLVMGAGTDRIGLHNSLIFCCGLAVISLVGLLFTREVWSFYLFAVVFGFAYGGEVPQIPLFVSSFGGTRSLATLIGLTIFIGNIGGALGPWVGGKIFDTTADYQWAFLTAIIVAVGALVLALVLKRQSRR